MPDFHTPLSLQELRDAIGYKKGWKSLLRYLDAVELAKGVTILKRVRGRKLTRYLVTLAAIQEHAPEILPEGLRPERPTQQLALRAAQDFLAHRDDRMYEIARNVVDKRATKQIERLSERLRGVESEVAQMKKSHNLPQSLT